MDLQEFARLVRDMRRHQRDYFRTKDGRALVASKEYEGRVDAAVKGVLDPQPMLPMAEKVAGHRPDPDRSGA